MSDSEEFTIIRGKNPVIANRDKVFEVTKKVQYSQVSKKLDSDSPPVIPKITTEIAVDCIPSIRDLYRIQTYIHHIFQRVR